MVTFTEAFTVETGSKITSAQMNNLARAFNDRLTSGVGDPSWRLWFKVHSLTRNIVDDADAPADEWLATYMHAPNDATLGFDPNIYNPMVHFVQGGAVVSDESRLDVIPTAPYTNQADLWELAKYQRGASVLEFGLEASPSLAAARSHQALIDVERMRLAGSPYGVDTVSGNYPVYLKGYGGVMPIPPSLTCGSPPVYDDEEGEDVPGPSTTGYWYTFTNMDNTASYISYTSCQYQAGTMDIDEDGVQSIAYGDKEFIVYKWNGNVERLPYANWRFGPNYGQTGLWKTDQSCIEPFMQQYASNFRGTESERATDNYGVKDKAFDFQRFLSTQYYLAPALGYTNEDHDAVFLTVVSASAEDNYHDDDYYSGSALYFYGAPDAFDGYFDIPSGYCVAGWKIFSSLTSSVSLLFNMKAVDNENNEHPEYSADVYDVTLPAGENTSYTLHVVPENPYTASFAGVPRLRVYTKNTIHADSGLERVEIDFLVLERRKPRIEDAYTLLRVGTTNGDGSSLDGIGGQVSAKDIETHYFSAGGLAGTGNAVPLQLELNTNPWYETLRKTIKDRVRLIKRNLPTGAPAIKGYAVEDGKTVLWFNRFCTIGGVDLDLFDGIVPSLTPVSTNDIQDGVTYRVSGSAITYAGTFYNDGETFTGLDGVNTFTGSGEVYQHEGIVSTAPRHGFTNEWQMFMSFNATKLSGPFAPEEWDKIGFLQNRCHFLGSQIYFEPLCYHAAYGYCPAEGAPLVTAPSAHNYWNRINANDAYIEDNRRSFFTSCPMYPPDYRVDSATYDKDTGEVKIRFTTRFANCGTGSNIAREDGPNACSDEPYRTDENAIRQYLWSKDESGSQCQLMIGDCAELFASDTYGSCHPRFYFTKLFPYVRVDKPQDNDTKESSDTRCIANELQWMTFALSAICEGYIDVPGLDSINITECPDRPPQYRFENLMAQVPGHNWTMGIMPEYATGSAVREDRAQGYGPFANTVMYTSHFNRLAGAINLLRTVPLEIPWAYQHRTRVFEYYRAWPNFESIYPDQQPGPCTGSNATTITTNVHPCCTDVGGDQPGVGRCDAENLNIPEGWMYGTIVGDFPDQDDTGLVERSSANDLLWRNGFQLGSFANTGIATSLCDTVGAGQVRLRLSCASGSTDFNYTLGTLWSYNEVRIIPVESSSVWYAIPDSLKDNVYHDAFILGQQVHTEEYKVPHYNTSSGFAGIECGDEFCCRWPQDYYPLTIQHPYTQSVKCRLVGVSDGVLLSLRQDALGVGNGGGFGAYLCPGSFDAFMDTSVSVAGGGSNIACGAGGSMKYLEFNPVTDAFSAIRIPLTSSVS